MSFIFDVDDETVWSPALRVGQVYAGSARQLGAILNIDTGLHEVADDLVEIDVEAFERFTRALLAEHLRSDHPIHRALSRGTLLVSLALLERAGRPLNPQTQDEHDLNRQAVEYTAWMPS
jgi:Family of unknown function (DUF6086)